MDAGLWHTAAWVCAGIGLVMMLAMAYAFWRSPEAGFSLTTHRLEQLPSVMADRYMAFALLLIFMLWYGDLVVLAAFFVIGAFMGLADGFIYARRGLPHWKHTASGILSVAAFGITMAALAQTGAA